MQTTRRVKRRNLKIVGDLMKFKYALVREPGDLYKNIRNVLHPIRKRQALISMLYENNM
jgi:hypothetical protein